MFLSVALFNVKPLSDALAHAQEKTKITLMRDQRFGNSNNVKVLCVLGHMLTFSIWRRIIFYKITTEALLF